MTRHFSSLGNKKKKLCCNGLTPLLVYLQPKLLICFELCRLLEKMSKTIHEATGNYKQERHFSYSSLYHKIYQALVFSKENNNNKTTKTNMAKQIQKEVNKLISNLCHPAKDNKMKCGLKNYCLSAGQGM